MDLDGVELLRDFLSSGRLCLGDLDLDLDLDLDFLNRRIPEMVSLPPREILSRDRDLLLDLDL